VFAVSKDVRRGEDLKGKIIATSQVGGRAGEIARMVIRNMGLDPDKDVNYLAVGGTMSRLAALSTGKVHAAPISHTVVPIAEDRGLRILQIEPIPLIVDALWTSRKFAECAARLCSGNSHNREGPRQVLGDYAQVHENFRHAGGARRLRTLQRRLGPSTDTLGQGDQDDTGDKPSSGSEAGQHGH
ncbi:MAG: NMT1-like family, partial [Deltaproteobacteria bacterium]|nr:NMT1-like family [Deltaproteobacteria bacterium]